MLFAILLTITFFMDAFSELISGQQLHDTSNAAVGLGPQK